MATNKKPAAKKTTQKSAITHREEMFIEAYLTNGGNATDAARQAGYSEKSVRELARRLLTKVDIKTRIKERVNEAKVTSDEVVGTLAAQMRGRITDVLPDDGGLISEIKKKNLGHLIKKIKIRREVEPGTLKQFEVAEVELYSSQSAAQTLAKVLGYEQEPKKNEHDLEMETAKFEKLISWHMDKYNCNREDAIAAIEAMDNPELSKIRMFVKG